MAERDSWAVQATGPAGLLDVEECRVAVGAMFMPGTTAVKSQSGFRPGPGTSPGLVTATGTPDANVNVAPFQAIIQTGRATTGGTYIATCDTTKVVDILVAHPANVSNPRNDLIIAQQTDTFYGDGTSTFVVKQVVGTPSGTPVDPTITGSTDYILLARVRVNASVTTITSGVITDLRPAKLYTVGLGGVLPVASATVRNALAGLYDGMCIYRQDRDWVEAVDGGGLWRVVGVPSCTTVSDLSSVTNPYTGQLAYVSAAPARYYTYTGAAWLPYPNTGDGLIYTATSAVATTVATTEVIIATSTTQTFKAGRAYRFEIMGAHLNATVGDLEVFRVRKGTTTAGTLYGQYQWSLGTNTHTSNAFGWVRCGNYTGSDIVTQVVFTMATSGGTGGGWGTGAVVHIEDIGTTALWSQENTIT